MNDDVTDPAVAPPPEEQPAAEHGEGHTAPPRRRRSPRRPAADAAAAGEGERAASPTDAQPSAAAAEASDGVASSASEGAEPASAEASAADGEPAALRRGRNRRRGRRGRGTAEAAVRAGDAAVPQPGGERDADDEADAGAVAPPTLVHEDPNALFASVLAGDFDAEPIEAEATPVPHKRVLAPEPDAPKLHKLLAQAGIGSRRDMEQMILEGRVTVNGAPAHIGQRISWGDQVKVGGKPVKLRIAPPPPRVLAYHKPVGEVVTHDDPQQRPTVFRRLPRLHQGKWQSVGRLDINTEGLLLFTNSGELANQLMHPRFGVEREYAVRVLGLLDDAGRERLLAGVEIDGQAASFKSIEDGGGEGANHWYRVVITEGRHREVRRLFEAVGLTVSRLIRIRYGTVVLPRGLKRGMWVDLGDADVKAIRRLAQGAQGGQGVQAVRPPQGGDTAGRGSKRRRRGRGAGEGGERGERGEGGAIPNPLQQTYDKRAIQRERAQRPEVDEDGPIPNPLQQTYDKRALQRERAPRREYDEDGPIPNPLQQTYDKRFVQGERGPGGGRRPGGAGATGPAGRGPGGKKRGGGTTREPDPMRTSVGYIGGDALLRKGGRGGGRSGGGGGRRGPR